MPREHRPAPVGQDVRVRRVAKLLRRILALAARRLVFVPAVLVAAVVLGLSWARYRGGRLPLSWTQAAVICGGIMVVAVLSSGLILLVGRRRPGQKSQRANSMPPLTERTLGPYLREEEEAGATASEAESTPCDSVSPITSAGPSLSPPRTTTK